MGGIPGETDGALLARMGTDAAEWAREFVDAVRRIRAREVADPGPSGPMSEAGIVLDPTPGEFLHVWMVGALEAGRAAGYSRGRRDAERAVRNHVAGWPVGRGTAIVNAVAWPQPADLAGRPPADSAGRTQPADLAGRDARRRHEEDTVAGSDVGRAADALEKIARSLAEVTAATRRSGDLRGRT